MQDSIRIVLADGEKYVRLKDITSLRLKRITTDDDWAVIIGCYSTAGERVFRGSEEDARAQFDQLDTVIFGGEASRRHTLA